MKGATRVATRSESIDAATIEQCRQGDPQALARVFRQEAPALERVLYRIVGSTPDVEDLLQTTFIEAMRAFPRFRGEASVRTWMTRIAVRTAMAHLKHPDRRRRVALEVVEPDDDGGALPDDQLANRRRVNRLRQLLDRLSLPKRTAFVLHVFEGHSTSDVAALMGASRAATKSRIFFARRELLQAARRDPIMRELLAEGGQP